MFMVFSEDKLFKTSISEELKTSYLSYAMSVIVGRALPDVRDGLKPVQRRILYTMLELGLLHNKAFKKSATIVGNTMAKYHPHGDAPIYEAMVRMAQDFASRYPLIQGQGNFGSVDGDSPAALRYTEARLSMFGELMLTDVEKQTVDWRPNFDASLKEPIVLPAKIPNLLINGSQGIAVGMATSIPPHNLKEVCEAIIKLIDNPEISFEEMLSIIKGPDFPTGGVVTKNNEFINAYKKGKGKITIKGVVDIEDSKLIIKEIPFNINKSVLISQIAEGIKKGLIFGVKDLRDESSRGNIRIVLELENLDVMALTEKQLFKHTNLETSTGVMFIALKNNKPQTFNIKELLQEFINHRKNIIERRTSFLLKKAEDKKHLLEGLRVALNNIDDVIAIIKSSENNDRALNKLMLSMNLTKKQADAVLNMRLQKLTRLEYSKIEKDIESLEDEIKNYKGILSSDKNILEVVKKEVLEIIELGDVRKTRISTSIDNTSHEELIPEENIIITVTTTNYVKSVRLKDFKNQLKGGKGLKTSNIEHPISLLLHANTHDHLLVFTETGRAFKIKAYKIPILNRYNKGSPITSFGINEKVKAVIAIKNTAYMDESNYLVFATKRGVVKRLPLKASKNIRSSGLRVLGIKPGDELNTAIIAKQNQKIFIYSKKARAVLFDCSEIREQSRTAKGVKGLKLSKDDFVQGLEVVDDNQGFDKLVVITSKGFGKKVLVSDYRMTHRAARGVKNARLTQDEEIVKCLNIKGDEDLMVATINGHTIRFSAKQVPLRHRTARGVRIIKLNPIDKVVTALRL